MLDRLDDGSSRSARLLHGPTLWAEMKENAADATSQKTGGARLVAQQIAALMRSRPLDRAAHRGSQRRLDLARVLAASADQHQIERRARSGGRDAARCGRRRARSAVFEQCYLPALARGTLGQLSLFTLTDSAEQDDNCANIYHKSLLYLVSHALEEQARSAGFRDGVPLLGMSKFVTPWNDKHELFGGGKAEWVRAPNDRPIGTRDASRARSHGDFDDDRATFEATLARILGTEGSNAIGAPLPRTSAGRTALRKQLERAAVRA